MVNQSSAVEAVMTYMVIDKRDGHVVRDHMALVDARVYADESGEDYAATPDLASIPATPWYGYGD